MSDLLKTYRDLQRRYTELATEADHVETNPEEIEHLRAPDCPYCLKPMGAAFGHASCAC